MQPDFFRSGKYILSSVPTMAVLFRRFIDLFCLIIAQQKVTVGMEARQCYNKNSYGKESFAVCLPVVEQ